MLDSELEELSKLYDGLKDALSGFGKDNKPASTLAKVHSIIRNEVLFVRLEQMNARLGQLAKDWEKLCPQLDAASRKKTQQLAAKVREQAANLRVLNEARTHEIEAHRAKLERELAIVTRGSKYLESVKPLKSNFPKFIDSRG